MKYSNTINPMSPSAVRMFVRNPARSISSCRQSSTGIVALEGRVIVVGTACTAGACNIRRADELLNCSVPRNTRTCRPGASYTARCQQDNLAAPVRGTRTPTTDQLYVNLHCKGPTVEMERCASTARARGSFTEADRAGQVRNPISDLTVAVRSRSGQQQTHSKCR